MSDSVVLQCGANLKKNLRRYTRVPFARTITYMVSVLDFSVVRRIQDSGISSDISAEGLCLITGYPLETGHVFILEDSYKRPDADKKLGVVKWVSQVGENRYRAGVQLV